MIVAVIQARVTSSRLPGKVLLPIRQHPAVVLAARRAANLGLRVVVATSDQSSDDMLAAVLQEQALSVARGPLEDVLQRFVIATQDLPDSTVVIRLTADNVFPDGAFIGELADQLQRTGRDYLGTSHPESGLPYGLSAEAFTVSALREADRRADTPFDREHVTPWLRRRSETSPFRPGELSTDLSHLRCTVDCLDDYERVVQAFSLVEDPVTVPWRDLCRALQRSLPNDYVRPRLPDGRQAAVPVLGTAQLGLPSYGRTNTIGRPEAAVAVGLIRTAVRNGVLCVDTARSYEDAEKIVGEALEPFGDRVKVITKLSPLPDLAEDSTADQVQAAVDASVFRSCRELGLASLPVLLLHRWAHRTSHGGMVWQRLVELKDQGVLGQLGASVGSPGEAEAALRDPSIQCLQLPFNLLDHRWLAAGIDKLAVKRPDVVIHARSVLLQGILAVQPESWPSIAGVDPAEIVSRLEALALEWNRSTRADLCLAYVRSQAWIHGVVIGTESVAQLLDLLTLFARPPLSADEQGTIRRTFSSLPESLLNPALWPAQ
jgi:spore coat polysaccharide biosynthesis protein SpsF